MQSGQHITLARHFWVRRRLTAAVLMVGFGAFWPLPQASKAAIDPAPAAASKLHFQFVQVAETSPPPVDALVPPVKREKPSTPTATPSPAAAPEPPPAADTAPPAQPAADDTTRQEPSRPPEYSGIWWTIQEWLARANRDYQGVVVKELSLPPAGAAGEDEIARKLKEQQIEDAKAAAEMKRAEDDAKKASEAKKLDEDRKRAAETKRLADEAKKKADEILKAAPAPTPDVAQPASPPAPSPEDAARIAEQQKLEAQKLADEARRQKELEAQRAAAEKAAEVKAADERRKAAEAAAQQAQHRTRTIVLSVEPIVRPVDPGTVFRPDLAHSKAARRVQVAQAESDNSEPVTRRRVKLYRAGAAYGNVRAVAYVPYRGTAVKRWVWRAQSCRRAGIRITPPARYTIKRGDSLWRISERHYNEGRLYPKIYSANRSRIADPDLIYPCQRVLVPRR